MCTCVANRESICIPDYASVSFTDWNLGQLLASLQSSGVEKDTVVVLHA